VPTLKNVLSERMSLCRYESFGVLVKAFSHYKALRRVTLKGVLRFCFPRIGHRSFCKKSAGLFRQSGNVEASQQIGRIPERQSTCDGSFASVEFLSEKVHSLALASLPLGHRFNDVFYLLSSI
jgi:hypothetical protein